jgi:hypothetical protein
MIDAVSVVSAELTSSTSSGLWRAVSIGVIADVAPAAQTSDDAPKMLHAAFICPTSL